MRKVWQKSFWYSFFRPYIQWAVRTSYSRITVKGIENIPNTDEASVIITPNHCNTLMDALVVLQSRKAPTTYVARADIFGKPFFARILNNLRILPIYRRRDGVDTWTKNAKVFDAVVDILNHGMVFSIFPEGAHRARRSLLPMKKGVFRIAFQAIANNPERPVFIVPTGLEYYDYYNIMSPVTISYGKPIRIKGDEDMKDLSELLYGKIAELITFFPDDENLDAAESAFYASRKRQFNILHRIGAIILLPAFLAVGFLCSPMLLATGAVSRSIKDKVWMNTVRFCCKLTLTPFTVAGAAVAGFCHLSWPLAIALIVLTAYAHPLFYLILRFYKELSGRHYSQKN